MRLALRRLDRLWSRIADRGGDLRQLSAMERHRLRIDTKKLRYALEFLAQPLEPAGADQKKFGKAAEGLQDSLGLLNDLATRPQFLASAIVPTHKEAERLLRTAKRHWQKLEAIGPYWREAMA
jgi:CHAD domain-containing protein